MERILNPRKIESKSFEIIENFLPDLKNPDREQEIARRVIHATADLEYYKELLFHPCAVDAGISAIKAGKNIIVDVTMVRSGINKKKLASSGGEVICLINREDISRSACENEITKTAAAMRAAAEMMDGAIAAIGNAPTALFELCDLVCRGKAKPALIVGIPVGFVGAIESKNELAKSKIPFITNRSKKGGSAAATAIINALLEIARKEG